MRMATSNVLEMVGIDMFEGSFSIGRGPCRLPALPIILSSVMDSHPMLVFYASSSTFTFYGS